ncbi:potassium channel family protein [Shimia abyssi]|nr:potassium channel family protein [Shimia abyssi]
MQKLKAKLTSLYHGDAKGSVQFRYALILFDVVTIGFFVATAHLDQGLWLNATSLTVGFIILADLLARLWVAEDPIWLLRRVYTIADILVILSLLLDPFLTSNLAFLRVLRGLRLVHSYRLLDDMRRDSRFFREHEDTVIATVNLLVFVMVTTLAVLVFFLDREATTTPYLDALYFTVATLTTTGFGDITLNTPAGKAFSVVVMVVGVTLFVQLARAILKPRKAQCECAKCGLLRHDLDAVHCKHCGEVIHIETEGL